MFKASELELLQHLLVDVPLTDSTLHLLQQQHTNLEAVLLRSRILRQVQQVGYVSICQEHMNAKAENAAFLFAPFILANLNQKVIYATPQSPENIAILNRYYQAEAKLSAFKVDDVLSGLNVYIELHKEQLSPAEYFYFGLINSLCNPKVSKIICITHLHIDLEKLKQLAEFLDVEIHVLADKTEEIDFDLSKINMLKLLFKDKDQQYIDLCQKFSFINAKILQRLGLYEFDRAQVLVEDMFYSEHIFEKISVYGEYIQTHLQHQVKKHSPA